MPKKKKISIVTGVYNEEAIVADVYRVIKQEMAKFQKYDYEHIFTDNCSQDKTLKVLKNIARKDKRVKIICLSKNFGPDKSGFTALVNTSGDAVIPYEGSMKDPVGMIGRFIRYWEEGYKIVYGIRIDTGDSWLMKRLRKFFYKILNLMTNEDLPENVGSYRIMDQVVVDEIKKIDDYKPYTRGLIGLVGFKKKGIKYRRRPRKKGSSKNNLAYLLDFAINGLISYSIFPIRLLTYIGLSLSSLSFLGAMIYLLLKIFYWKITIPGITGVIFLILFFSGIQLFFLGVIGEYVGAIHSQVRKKPFVVIKEKINF